MTYESALQWGIDHVDMSEYEDYDDWYSALEEKYQTPALTDNPEFQQMSLDSWNATMGEAEPPIIDRERPKDITVEQGFIVTPSGARPAIVADTQPTTVSEPNIVIEQTGTTGRITRSNFRERISNIGKAISGFFRRKR